MLRASGEARGEEGRTALCIDKAVLDVCPDRIKRRVLARLNLCLLRSLGARAVVSRRAHAKARWKGRDLDIVERDRLLDHLVVVWVEPLIRQLEEIGRD